MCDSNIAEDHQIILYVNNPHFNYRIYLIKHHPQSNAADGSKITNKCRPQIKRSRRMRRLHEDNKKNLGTTW